MDARFKWLSLERKELTSSIIINCSGLLDGKVATELQDLFNGLPAENKKNFIFDFSGVIKISEKAVELFVDLADRLRQNGKHLFIIKINSNLRIRKNLKLITELERACLSSDEDGLEDFIDGDERLYCF